MLFKSPYPDVDIPMLDVATFVLKSDGVQDHLSENAIIDATFGETLTFGSIHDGAYALAAGLIKQIKFEKWQVLALYSPNKIHYLSIVLGTLLAGGTMTPVDATCHVNELTWQLKDSGASVLVVANEATAIANAKAAADRVGIPTHRIFVIGHDPQQGIRPIFDLFISELPPTITFTDEELDSMPAYIVYSHAISGQSKGVMCSHRNIVASMLQSNVILQVMPVLSDKWLSLLPFSHLNSLIVTLQLSYYKGIPLITMSSFDVTRFLNVIQTYVPRTVFMLSSVAIALAESPDIQKHRMTSLERIISEGAPISAQVSKTLSNRLNSNVMQWYGGLETSALISCSTPPIYEHGSIGSLAPNMSARIVDPVTGVHLCFGEVGELCLHGPNTMQGYTHSFRSTAPALDSDGFFHTGNMAKVSRHGELTLVRS
ncbi:hypothetical protein BASA50_002896 [Batrachochytrium salamandrivorans]|uniref:AMP-dependent synthetase/ligase domain-containing protein n=1 Tax=Batrachochytrium salamandrivorans TaxID=1357716 RepID=A0ABQ8FJU4_9FUNG|nr:hypothetical protein BASA62_000828 [Batrachochytrium salamandrivorans]KAH6599553.1 hypothetical protein BASA50_002896 [Batrachochytrium salamandrivorans]KAJ1344169.1 hypothetical protein BSLG_001309 [Batrachochytrium salamandrivorans]